MKKDILAICAIVLIVIIIISGTKIQSVDEYYLSHIDDIQNDSETVFISIRCDTVFDNYDKLRPELKNGNYIPQNGIILERKEYVLRKGDTVYDILSRAVRHNKLQAEYKKTSSGDVYVQGIANLYEFDCGELSGWTFTVNGKLALTGCNQYTLSAGDEIIWCYTCDLGREFEKSPDSTS